MPIAGCGQNLGDPSTAQSRRNVFDAFSDSFKGRADTNGGLRNVKVTIVLAPPLPVLAPGATLLPRCV
jgi:hypothetical protein